MKNLRVILRWARRFPTTKPSPWSPVARRFLAACTVASLLACSDATSPVGITGSYVATTFLFGPTGQTPTDVLTVGGSMSIQIAADSTTSGNLTVPGSVTGGATLVANMAGTVTQTGDTLRFTQSANSFVRSDFWLKTGENTLRFDRTLDGTTLVVVLTR
jgi:hypothetical protein